MNCQLCQKKLDAYREGKLPEGILIQVDTHLEECEDCTAIYRMIILSDKIMDEEKKLQSNPFLVTRIMAGIEDLALRPENNQKAFVFEKVLKSALITVSLAAAILVGIADGNLYKPVFHAIKPPVEMLYLNDAALESVNLLTNE